MSKINIITVILLICLVSIECKQDYTYYLFEREWGNTICKTRSCKPQYYLNYNGQDFNVHGLWANGSVENQCQYWQNCEDDDYVQSELKSDLLNWMDEYYVGLYNDSEDFRAHEYEKHGTCYNYDSDVTTNAEKENAFFGKIQDLTNQYDLVKAMNEYGIYASDSKLYNQNDVMNALAQSFNNYDVNFTIKCQKIQNKYYLSIIDLCLDLDFKLMDCPCTSSSCNSPFYIPASFPTSSSNNIRKEIY
ncbi:Ribonuclease T2-like protein [Pseudocohnilembus persalinus]|uniref:Ribonuclease T2-like protein n=1 Tax=Pseudocohnilembus persalinus TaxID=266149 RepID=A0A0V0QQ12_PSEPJ|nr:Ribonuclease T2-like protein [Pseudocohnilembus persalinus]|eukprot:KRX04294.1 Ribonuclease T2-like protein [Pseudocohnilembus persalinus]